MPYYVYVDPSTGKITTGNSLPLGALNAKQFSTSGEAQKYMNFVNQKPYGSVPDLMRAMDAAEMARLAGLF
ncbi:hypothetical protein [Rhodospira trueperi]|uniref:Uncharacterized protein n=1 Tax=Rhodospira trueperi TaxID=69960 RepID=A0A1G6X3G0_9PROT|nr:hypothetical protein [Rhodospira trueperi]SDD71796.1 hypothetical protein SAMN05421720_101339 [Rhodospira trueperi]